MSSHSNTCYTTRWLPMFTKAVGLPVLGASSEVHPEVAATRTTGARAWHSTPYLHKCKLIEMVVILPPDAKTLYFCLRYWQYFLKYEDIFDFNLPIVSFHANLKFSQKSKRRCWTIVAIEHDSINEEKWNKILIKMLKNVQQHP